MVGKIHSIETFGTVDGPGIRFVTFFQGCNLECKYCHNRDTREYSFGTKYTVDEIVNKVMGTSSKSNKTEKTEAFPNWQHGFFIKLW